MKAPEKIYLRKRNKLPLEVVCDKWYETDLQNIYGSVEYTRTDAFIEKALAYLNEKFYFNNLHYAVENNTFHCMEEMFEDFKNYIKGE
jgi:hypothetical protein